MREEDRKRRTEEQKPWILFFSPWASPELVKISHLPSDLEVLIGVSNTGIRKDNTSKTGCYEQRELGQDSPEFFLSSWLELRQ